MTDNMTAMPIGRLSLSRISYNCDLQSASGLIIPLGAIGEMTLGPMRVLGLIARTSLLDEELEQVGRLLRHQLSDPFDFLEKEFDWALDNTNSGEALQELARRHDGSLLFSPPTFEEVEFEEVEKAAVLSVNADTADHAKDVLRKSRDHEFSDLMMGTWPSAQVVPNRSVSELAA